MKEKLSPQEKKRLSYKKDHRTHTGEDNRAWRKAWAARKGRVNRKYRRKTDAVLREAIGPNRIDARKAGDEPTTRGLMRKGLTRENNSKKWGVGSLGQMLKARAEAHAERKETDREREEREAKTYKEQIVALERDASSPLANELLSSLRFGDGHLKVFYRGHPEWKKRLRAKLTELQKAQQKAIKTAKLKAEQKWKWRSPALRKPRAEQTEK